MNFCNKIRYNKDIGILCLHSDRMYDNLILGIHTMSIWFLALKTGCDSPPADVLPFDTFNRGVRAFRRMTIEPDGNLRAYYWAESWWTLHYTAITEPRR
jgi:hypothetical protein